MLSKDCDASSDSSAQSSTALSWWRPHEGRQLVTWAARGSRDGPEPRPVLYAYRCNASTIRHDQLCTFCGSCTIQTRFNSNLARGLLLTLVVKSVKLSLSLEAAFLPDQPQCVQAQPVTTDHPASVPVQYSTG